MRYRILLALLAATMSMPILPEVLSRLDGVQPQGENAWKATCPFRDCGKRGVFWLSDRGYSCHGCERKSTDLGYLRGYLDRDGWAPGPEREAERFPTLADRWREELRDILDPDRFILRPSEAGMGRSLDRQLGGGFTPGQTVSFVSHGAGVGKTAFVHQLFDGIARRNERELRGASLEGRTAIIVPIVFVSEMSERDLSLRSMARQAGVEGYLLRDPRGERGCRPLADGLTEGEAAIERAAVAAEAFQEAARFLTLLDRRTKVSIETVRRAVRAARSEWQDRGAEVPMVFVGIDPGHRILDPTKPEVEAIGHMLPQVLDLAQQEDVVALVTSDTTKVAASIRKELGGIGRGEDLAALVELAFRASYQFVHTPDVALGLVTLRLTDDALSPEDRDRLSREPDGTVYAEIVNAKSRWDRVGRRAAYFLDPAMFRFRPTSSRHLRAEMSLEERIVDFVETHPGCSANDVRKGVKGGSTDAKRAALEGLIRSHRIEDEGDNVTGRRLHVAGSPHRSGSGQGQVNPQVKAEGQGVDLGAPPKGGEPPSGQPHPLPVGEVQEG